VDGQETLSQQALDAEVRMISLAFNFSGATLSMLTPLGDYFQNLGASLESGVNVGEATLALSPVALVSPPVIAAAAVAGKNVDAATGEQFEEGEVPTIAWQETAEPSSQRFDTQTPPVAELGDVDVRLGAPTPAVVEAQDVDANMGGGNAQVVGAVARGTRTLKGTITATLDFDESDEDVFDEEAEDSRAAHLIESTINVNTGEKVACQLEGGLTIGFLLILSLAFSFLLFY